MNLITKLTKAVRLGGEKFSALFVEEIKNAGQLTDGYLIDLVTDLEKQIGEDPIEVLADSLPEGAGMPRSMLTPDQVKNIILDASEASTTAALKHKAELAERDLTIAQLERINKTLSTKNQLKIITGGK